MTVGVSGHQMRAARAIIGLSQAEIAAVAGVTRQTIERMERSGSQPVVSRNSTVAAVLAALGARGDAGPAWGSAGILRCENLREAFFASTAVSWITGMSPKI
jgi:DNA-binding XRE family transcriptional regulator